MQKKLIKVGLSRVGVLLVLSLGLMSGAALAESGQMDHSKMDHGNMDHSQMNHAQMDHSKMDHGSMDHGQMDHSQMNHAQMDHGQMDHGQMDMSGHDHSQHKAMLAKKGVLARTVATYELPDVKLLDASGAKVSLRTVFDGKEPAILNFIFTTCTTICPVMSATFEQVQAKLGKKRSHVRMVSISIDPENDTPAKLKDYAERFHAGKQWQMLTGSVADSNAVQRAFDVAVADKMNHKAAVFIRAKGRAATWVKLDGLVSAADVVAELNAASK